MADYPEILQDIKRYILLESKKQSITNEVAEQIAHGITEKIRHDWGGLSVYIPKGTIYALSVRDQQIYDDFNGNNHHEICRKYNISLQWLYKVIAAQKRIDSHNRQSDLFPKHV